MLPIVIEPEALEPLLENENLLIIDLCRDEIYQQYHLPGAVHISPGELVSGVQPAVGKLPTLEQLERIFSRIGYSPDQQIVVYDDEGGGWAGRFIWTLDVIGHQKSTYLNGGLIAWANEGRPMTAAVPEVAPTSPAISISTGPIAEKADVMESLEDPTTVVWDARSPEEYAGTRVVAARGGHIPGAVNLDWVELMDRHNNLKLKTDLQQLVSQRGFEPDIKIITHCQTHHRSGLTYLVGKTLGYDIRGYHGSWSEWGNDPDTPITNPAV